MRTGGQSMAADPEATASASFNARASGGRSAARGDELQFGIEGNAVGLPEQGLGGRIGLSDPATAIEQQGRVRHEVKDRGQFPPAIAVARQQKGRIDRPAQMRCKLLQLLHPFTDTFGAAPGQAEAEAAGAGERLVRKVQDVGVIPRRDDVGVELGLLDRAGLDQRIGADCFSKRNLRDCDGPGIPEMTFAKQSMGFFRKSRQDLARRLPARWSGDVDHHAAERAEMVGHADHDIRPSVRIGDCAVNQVEQFGFQGSMLREDARSTQSVAQADDGALFNSAVGR